MQKKIPPNAKKLDKSDCPKCGNPSVPAVCQFEKAVPAPNKIY